MSDGRKGVVGGPFFFPFPHPSDERVDIPPSAQPILFIFLLLLFDLKVSRGERIGRWAEDFFPVSSWLSHSFFSAKLAVEEEERKRVGTRLRLLGGCCKKSRGLRMESVLLPAVERVS